jgi:DNA-binding GntR family transcriptional regulator
MKRRSAKDGREKPAELQLSVRDRAYLHIQQAIASGELGPGDVLSEVELAGELGSSRTPVREAIGQLVSEGLLEQTPNRATTVARLTRDDIVDLYELREALEVFAAGKVARQGAASEDLSELQSLADAILPLRAELAESSAKVLSNAQMKRFMRADLSFHSVLMRMALNPRMQKIVSEAQLLIRIFAIRRVGHELGMLDKIHAHHTGIVQALKKRQPERAIQMLGEHIQISLQERLEEFDAWNRARAMHRESPTALGSQAGRSS